MLLEISSNPFPWRKRKLCHIFFFFFAKNLVGYCYAIRFLIAPLPLIFDLNFQETRFIWRERATEKLLLRCWWPDNLRLLTLSLIAQLRLIAGKVMHKGVVISISYDFRVTLFRSRRPFDSSHHTFCSRVCWAFALSSIPFLGSVIVTHPCWFDSLTTSRHINTWGSALSTARSSSYAALAGALKTLTTTLRCNYHQLLSRRPYWIYRRVRTSTSWAAHMQIVGWRTSRRCYGRSWEMAVVAINLKS